MAGAFFLILLIELGIGFASGSIWSGKGGSFGAGFAIGFLLGVIGLVLVAVIEPSRSGAVTIGAPSAYPSPPRATAFGPNIPTVDADGGLRCQRCGRLNQPDRTDCIGCGSHFAIPFTPSPPMDLTSELERLAALHSAGKLTQQEFDDAKAKLLAR